MEWIFIWASAQAIILAALLLRKWNSEVGAVRLLSLFFFLTGLEIGIQYLLRHESIGGSMGHVWVFTYEVLNYLYGPVLLLYLKVSNYQKVKAKEILHFLPAVVFLIYFFISQPYIWEGRYRWMMAWLLDPGRLINLGILAVFNAVYVVLCFRQKNLHEVGQDKVWSRWIMLVTLFLVIKVLLILHSLGYTVFKPQISAWREGDMSFIFWLNNVFYALFNGVIILLGQFTIFANPDIFNIPEVFKQKFGNGKFSSKQAENIMSKLEDFVVTQQAFLNIELTERSVSQNIGVPVHTISKFLNDVQEKSFKDYVNYYRVEEAKRLLRIPSNKDKTLYSIALDSGFRSESTFYSNFKKHTDMTPRQYKISVEG